MHRRRRAFGIGATVVLATGALTELLFDPRGLLSLWPGFAFGAFVIAGWWMHAQYLGDRLIVARDRWRYVRSLGDSAYDLAAIGYDDRTGKVTVVSGLPYEQWEVPGLDGGEAGAEARRWLAGAVTTRARLVDDELLQQPTFASVQARLGLGATDAPFRSEGGALTHEVASSLLDDRSASRAELVAAAAVLVARGGEAERQRVLALEDDCDEAHFAELLRAIARGGDVEAAWTNLRSGKTTFERRLSPLRERLDRLGLVAIASMLALWRAPSIELLRSLAPGLAIVALLGEARRFAHAQGRLRGGAFTSIAHRSGYAYGSVLAAAIATAAMRSVIPVAIVPVLLFAAFWGVQIPWARRREARVEKAIAEAARASQGEETQGTVAPVTTTVRVVVDAREGEPHEEHERSAVANEHKRRH